jgi:1-acylglycerol-3-phosphate O-acyltransferase
VYNTAYARSDDHHPENAKPKNSYDTNIFDDLQLAEADSDTLVGSDESGDVLTPEEKNVLDRIGEDLARLGRVKRIALGVKEKDEFVKAWTRKRN